MSGGGLGRVAGLLLAGLCAVPAAAQAPDDVEPVAAFARLYGVTRWFYPSDAAASLDWNRFAVYGVRRVRSARSATELEETLRELFAPLGPGIEIGTTLPSPRPRGARDPELVAWRYRGPGFSELATDAYSARRINRAAPASSQPAASILTQSIAADTLRGRAVRLRGRVRVGDPNADGWAGLWLRVDRPRQTMGFFDNMQDRPIRDTTWREYVIEGTIASDATQIVFGALRVGEMSVDVDAIEVAVRRGEGEWTPLAVRDAGFEASEDRTRPSWEQNQATPFPRVRDAAPEGERFLRMVPSSTPQASGAARVRAADETETPVAGATSEFVLSGSLRARVALSLTDAEARTVLPALGELRAALSAIARPAGSDDPDVRLADVVVAWSVFRHFYPYWSDVPVDWDARLRPQLATALAAGDTRQAHVDAVRLLVADLQDGHGMAQDVARPKRLGTLPVSLRVLNDQLVVTASGDTMVPVGSVITHIDGASAATRVQVETQLASGTPQWKRTRAEGALQLCPADVPVTLTIEPPIGPTRTAVVPCPYRGTRIVEARPDSITELEPGIWYVDLTRVLAAQLRPMLPRLAKARGVVFDVRGYPTDAGAAILPHLMRSAERPNDRWMHIPRYVEPFATVAAWQDVTWGLQPASPQIGGARVFLTDGRAISYAESVMGYVRDYALGTIIGGTTAGANGNIATFTVPGGITVVFTGMRVTRHDGRTPYHVAGVAPEIPVVPTLEGIRSGRDELLARALDVLRVQP